MNVNFVSVISAIVGGLLAFISLMVAQYAASKSRERKARLSLEKALLFTKLDYEAVQAVVAKAKRLEQNNLRMALIHLAIEIELCLRRAADKMEMKTDKVELGTLVRTFTKQGIFNGAIASIFDSVWATRNKAIHALDVSDVELDKALSLAATLVLMLRRVWPDSFESSSILTDRFQ